MHLRPFLQARSQGCTPWRQEEDEVNIFKQLHTGGAGLRVEIVRGARMADIDDVRDLSSKPHEKCEAD